MAFGDTTFADMIHDSAFVIVVAALALAVFLLALGLCARRRRQAETACRQERERLRDFAEAGSDWLWETDSAHRIVSGAATPGGARAPWYDAPRGNGDSAMSWQEFEALLEKREPFREFEFRFADPGGEIRFASIDGRPRQTEDGRFAGFRGSSRDVTETTRMIDELRHNERKFADIAASTFDRFWELDRNHRYLFATDSQMMRDRGGRPGATFTGKTLWEVLGLDPDRNEAMGRYRDVLEARKPFRHFRVDMPLPNGNLSHRELSGTPVFDENGEFQGYRGSTRDISDIVAASETLRASEENYRALIDGSVQGVFIHQDFRPIYANQTCADIYGYASIDEVMALPTVLDLWAPYERARIDNYRHRRLQGEDVPERFEGEGRRKDGSPLWLMSTAKVIRWNGRPAIQTTVIDVTDLRRAQDALQRSSARMEAVLDATPLAIAAMDTEMRITIWTRAAEKMYGWTAAEVIGSEPRNVPAEEYDAYLRIAGQARESRSVVTCEAQRMHKDGHRMDVRVFMAPIENENGSVSGYLSVNEDITEAKIAEDRLRQAQKMEAIGQLTGGIAHDFNNMLGVVIGNLDFAAERIHDDATTLKLLNNAIDGAKRGATLNRQLLAFSRQMPLAPEVVDLNVQVSGMAELLRRTLLESIELEVVHAGGLWHCEADPGQVENALLNLCLNARDAMPDGGKLTIETANIRLDEEYAAGQTEVKAGQYVMLAVTDTGCGMPPDVREKAFDPFFTTKPPGQGTGLGLSMVFGFAKQSGGHVAIYSEPGEGTTMKLYLPRAYRAAPERLSQAQEEAPRGNGEAVLVVEDHENLRGVVVSQLEALGYRVTESRNSQEAFAALEARGRFDLLLTDVVLPSGLNGAEVAAEAVRLCPDIGVLYMSGYTENAVIHHGRLDEGVVLLQKPFRRADLARKVREVLDARG